MSIDPSYDSYSEVYSKIGEKLYLTSEKADVYFIFESNGERVPAHKCILSSGSDVFEAMFYGPLLEKGDIDIVDASADAFKEFLRFFYFNKIDVSMENVSEDMYLGKKYNVPECLRLCANMLNANINVRNVITILGWAMFYEQTEIQASCESIFSSNVQEVLKSDGIPRCDRRVLEHILKMEFSPRFATELYDACMAWIKAVSKEEHLTRDIVRTYMGNLFYELQFGAMSLSEFVKILPEYGQLFDGNEYNDILQVISGQETETKIFKACQRQRRRLSWAKSRLILCDRYCDHGQSYFLRRKDATTFSTNNELLLGFFVISPMFKSSGIRMRNILNISATITANSTETLMQFTFDFSLDKGSNIYLPAPTIIKPGNIYQIRIKLPTTSYDSGYTNLGIIKTVKMEKEIVVEFHADVNGELGRVIRELGFNLINE